MRKREFKLFGKRIVICWTNDFIHSDREAEDQAMAVVASLPGNRTFWGGFGRGPLLVIKEMG